MKTLFFSVFFLLTVSTYGQVALQVGTETFSVEENRGNLIFLKDSDKSFILRVPMGGNDGVQGKVNSFVEEANLGKLSFSCFCEELGTRQTPVALQFYEKCVDSYGNYQLLR